MLGWLVGWLDRPMPLLIPTQLWCNGMTSIGARIESYHKTYVDTTEFLPLAKRGLIWSNVLVYCILIMLIGINAGFHFLEPTVEREEQFSYVVGAYAMALQQQQQQQQPILNSCATQRNATYWIRCRYLMEVLFFASINLALAFAFLFYGWQLARKTETTDGSSESITELQLVCRSSQPNNPASISATLLQPTLHVQSIRSTCAS
jgi:hypothetical protein